MHSFEVHSNESACRKKVRLGLELVTRGFEGVAFAQEAAGGSTSKKIRGKETLDGRIPTQQGGDNPI